MTELFDIQKEYRELLNSMQCNLETGEIAFDVQTALEQLKAKGNIQDSVEQVALFIKKLKQKRAQLEAKEKQCRELLCKYMLETDTKRAFSCAVGVEVKNFNRVVTDNVGLIPREYIKEVANTTKLLPLLKSGNTIPGVHLDQSRVVYIY